MPLYDNWSWDSVNKIVTMKADDVKGYSYDTRFKWSNVQDWIDAKSPSPTPDWTEDETNKVYISGIRFLMNDAAGTFYFGDEDAVVIFKDGIITANNQWLIRTNGDFPSKPCYFQSGTMDDEANKKCSHGCTYINLESTYTAYLIYGYYESSHKLYASKFISPNKTARYYYMNRSNPNQHHCWYCTFDNVTLNEAGNTDFFGITLLNNAELIFSRGGNTFKRFVVSNVSDVFLGSLYDPVTIEDFYVQNPGSSPYLFYLYSGAMAFEFRDITFVGNSGKTLSNIDRRRNYTLVNVTSESWAFTWTYSGTEGNVYRKYSVNYLVRDKDGNPLSGWSVKLYDVGDVLVYDEGTDANGRTASQDILMEVYEQSATPTTKNPHRRVVTNGVVTYTDYVVIDHKLVDETITVTPNTADVIKEIKTNRGMIVAFA